MHGFSSFWEGFKGLFLQHIKPTGRACNVNIGGTSTPAAAVLRVHLLYSRVKCIISGASIHQ